MSAFVRSLNRARRAAALSPQPGSELFDADAPSEGSGPGAGRVTSVGFSERDGWVALGYLERRAGSPVLLRAFDVAATVVD